MGYCLRDGNGLLFVRMDVPWTCSAVFHFLVHGKCKMLVFTLLPEFSRENHNRKTNKKAWWCRKVMGCYLRNGNALTFQHPWRRHSKKWCFVVKFSTFSSIANTKCLFFFLFFLNSTEKIIILKETKLPKPNYKPTRNNCILVLDLGSCIE